MAGHLRAFTEKHIKPDETILAHTNGYIGEMMGKGKDAQHLGILIVTNQRVTFYRKGFFGEVIESIQLKNISSIERKSFMGHYTIRIHTSHDQMEFKTFNKQEEQAINDAIESARADASPAAIKAAPNDMDKLEKLAEFRDRGLITDEEYQAKKSEFLAKL